MAAHHHLANTGEEVDYLKRKYKNVFWNDPKDYLFRDLGSNFYAPKISSSFCSASSKYLAVHLAGGGGKIMVMPVDKPGRYGSAQSTSCHNSANYSEWCPYSDNMLAVATRGSKLQVFAFDDDDFDADGLNKAAVQPIADFEMPTEKELTMCMWHPCARDTIVVISKDKKPDDNNLWVKNIATGEDMIEKATGCEIFHACWNPDGSQFLYTSRETKSKLYITDLRTDESPKQVTVGMKDTYVFFMDAKRHGCEQNYIGCIGKDNSQQKVFIKIWNAETLEEVKTIKVDGTETSCVPYFDSGRFQLWYYAKTESRLNLQRFFLIDGAISWKKSPKSVGSLMSKKGITGGCFLPQRGLNFAEVEIERFFALSTETKMVYGYSIVNPRSKKSAFDGQFYPNARGLMPSNDATSWMAGKDTPPTMWELDPSIQRDETGAAVFVKKASYSEMEAGLAKAREILTEEQWAVVQEAMNNA